MTHCKDWTLVSTFSNLTSWYQDILNYDNVQCYITDLFCSFVLPLRYADNYIQYYEVFVQSL